MGDYQKSLSLIVSIMQLRVHDLSIIPLRAQHTVPRVQLSTHVGPYHQAFIVWNIYNQGLQILHSFIPAISIAPLQVLNDSEALPTQHGHCIGVSRRSAQATAGKGLYQGPYMAARGGVEPTTLRLKIIVPTNPPPRPTRHEDQSATV